MAAHYGQYSDDYIAQGEYCLFSSLALVVSSDNNREPALETSPTSRIPHLTQIVGGAIINLHSPNWLGYLLTFLRFPKCVLVGSVKCFIADAFVYSLGLWGSGSMMDRIALITRSTTI